jgi:sulfate transport system ATP-binding protein
MSIEAKNINKRFGNFVALNDVNLEVRGGELLSLLGPSGSGKTTLMRIIAGLEFADSGSIILDGIPAHEKSIQQRNVGFVFQHYALFKHMTVFDNVAFGLRVRKGDHRPPEHIIRRKVMELLELVHLDAFHTRYPSQLSGGQRQRVALARALAVEPKVLLLDEPFGALDAKVRKELRRWMRRLHDEIHITSIFVTHDQEEAMEVSDRVVVMSNGRIEQIGSPEEVWHHPANAFVYDFLGNYNEFDGWKDNQGKVHLAEMDMVEVPITATTPSAWMGSYPTLGRFVKRVAPSLITEAPPLVTHKRQAVRRPSEGKAVKLYARPHEIYLTKKPEKVHEYIEAIIIHLNPAGSLVKVELERPSGQIIQAEIPKTVLDADAMKKGDKVYVRPKQTRVFE